MELLLVVAMISVIAAIAVPTTTDLLSGLRVGMSAREVERELHTARLRAVATDRAMLVRFNCPAANQYRMVELIGTPSAPAPNDANEQAATRCSNTAYPFPDQNTGVFDIPNNDGEVKQLDPSVQFTAATTVEFWPDGTVHVDAGVGNPWPMIPTNAPVSIVLQEKTGSTLLKTRTQKTIQVNGLGRIALQ
jgi:Tfp pilus assembly protein FimT